MGERSSTLLFALLVGALILGCGTGEQTDTRIESRFRNPPDESRMATYWWIFGPAWTDDEIDRELQVLSDAGIGRVMIFPLYPYEVDAPQRGIKNLEYLSPEFLERFRHAVHKARELSIQVDLVMGTGWPYGGPTIPQELSPRRIYAKTVPFTGAAGDQVTVRLPELEAHDELIAVQLVPADRAGNRVAIDLTRAAASGSVAFEVPPGKWELMVFVQGLTTQRHDVVFAAAGGGGHAIDHLDRRAVKKYLDDVSAKLANAVAPGEIRAMYSASFEVYETSWTPGFLDEFARRRGYSLRPHLAALFRNRGEESMHVRFDFWRTIAELAADNYLSQVGDWCRSHGFGFQAESYGVPPVTLASFAGVDYPMGEDYDWKEFNRTRWASSAAHFYEQNVVSVEAYTWLRMARYTSSLEDLKRGSDLHFVSGANRIVAHGYAYSPPSAGVPGWGYYAGAMLTENQPWWKYFPELSRYVHRAGYILSLGRPVADVALYLPEGDLAAEFPPSNFNLAKEVIFRLDRERTIEDYSWGLPRQLQLEADVVKTAVTNGYSLEGVDYSILSTLGTIEDGRFNIGHSSFRVIVLPGLRGLPLEVLERIVRFCRQGGTVISTLRLPEIAYGLKDHEQNAARLRELMDELYGGIDRARDYQEKTVGRGRAIFAGDETTNYLRALNTVAPDMIIKGGDQEVGFVHRRAGNQDFYFMANLGDQSKRLEVSFRAGNRKPRLWDPMTGEIRDARAYRFDGDRTAVNVTLEPYGSIFVEFGTSTAPPPEPGPGPAAQPEALPVSGPWKLSWPGTGISAMEMDELHSWTIYPAAKYFSGTGRYETTVHLPEAYLNKGPRLVLDLGDVRNVAEVWANGEHAGVVWKRPYRLDVTGKLRSGDNTLRVEVTNLLINHVLNQPVKDYSEIQRRYNIGIRIRTPDEKQRVKQPLPSGLLGPVRLIILNNVTNQQGNAGP